MNAEQQNLYTDTSGAPAPETDIETPATYKVLLDKRQSVEAALLQLQKRASKRGLSPLAWSWGKPFVEEVFRDNVGTKTSIAKIPLTFEGNARCSYEGWTFIAALEHLDGENIVRALPGETLPVEFRTRGAECDHCKLARKRMDTYVVRHTDGRLVQVGSTCLADFLGSNDAAKIALYATFLASARGLAEGGESEGGGGGSGDVALSQYLPIVAWCVREQGWTSRTVARERGSSATADIALHFMSCREPKVCKVCREANCKPTEEDIALGEVSGQWAESLSDAEVNAQAGSDYLHNVRVVARSGIVGHRSAGIAASIVTSYERAQGIIRKRAAKAALPAANTHVGTVGKREVFAGVTLDFVTGYDTQYGYTTILKFLTEDGACLVWKASNTDIARGDVGKKYDIKGTVKKHDEYKGAKQTLLSRCAVTEKKS